MEQCSPAQWQLPWRTPFRMFRSVEPVGRTDIPLGMPEESGQTLWLCRDALEPLQQAWPRLRRFG